jgi:hypothetical protein
MSANYRDLIAWKKAMTLAQFVYQLTQEQHRNALARCDEVGRLINGLLKASANRPSRKPFEPDPLTTDPLTY